MLESLKGGKDQPGLGVLFALMDNLYTLVINIATRRKYLQFMYMLEIAKLRLFNHVFKGTIYAYTYILKTNAFGLTLCNTTKGGKSTKGPLDYFEN